MSVNISPTTFEILTVTQCPLPPRKFKYICLDGDILRSPRTTAWYYRESFWISIRSGDNAQGPYVVYEVSCTAKERKKWVKRMSDMRVVDDYLSHFSLTTSSDIYQILSHTKNKDLAHKRTKGSIASIQGLGEAMQYHKKFRPTWQNRFTFLGVIARAMLNAYFIITNLQAIPDVHARYRVPVAIVTGLEAMLWMIWFTRAMYNVYSLMKRVCKGDTVHFQVKNVPDNLRQLGSLSVMRYLPNGESVVMFKKRYKEWFNEKVASWRFETANSKFKVMVSVRWMILTVLDVIGPLVAIFSLLFKMEQLDFTYASFTEWDPVNYISYFAFVNQVAGIRKVRNIEIEALEHFIFSGQDTKLSKEEKRLMHVWWNYTLVSGVANICDGFKYPIYDSLIFWYNINVQRIQMLFKDHNGLEGDHLKGMAIDWNAYYDEVDEKVKVEEQRRKKNKGKIAKANSSVLVSMHTDNHTDDEEDLGAAGTVDSTEVVEEENGQLIQNQATVVIKAKTLPIKVDIASDEDDDDYYNT